jgi:hypothetical protein
MDKLREGRTLSRQGNRIAARYREEHRRIDRLVSDAERSRPKADQRRELIRAATRSGRAAIKARAAADQRLRDALTRLLDAGLTIRDAADRLELGYDQARQVLRPPTDVQRPGQE